MMLLAAVTLNAFLAAFGGTWTCSPHVPMVNAPTSTWTIAAEPQSAWSVVRWRSRGEHGTAFVGYLPVLQQWIYEDFHSDGSWSSNVSPGPQSGVWTWTGTFTSPQRVLHGAIQWRRDRDEIRQSFGRMLGPSFRETSYSTCRPARG